MTNDQHTGKMFSGVNIVYLPRSFICLLITGYRIFISPLLGANCRFYPTCSQYAQEAVEVHGALKGGWLALKRLLKCHPFHPYGGGIDLVPEGKVKDKR